MYTVSMYTTRHISVSKYVSYIQVYSIHINTIKNTYYTNGFLLHNARSLLEEQVASKSINPWQKVVNHFHETKKIPSD